MDKHVLLCVEPQFFEEVLDELLDGSEGIEVAGEVGEHEDIKARIEKTHADVLILSETRMRGPYTTLQLLDLFPRLRVLVLVAAGNGATVHELQPTTLEVPRVSLGQLVKLIRRDPAPEI